MLKEFFVSGLIFNIIYKLLSNLINNAVHVYVKAINKVIIMYFVINSFSHEKINLFYFQVQLLLTHSESKGMTRLTEANYLISL